MSRAKVTDADVIGFLIATPKQATATEAARTQPPPADPRVAAAAHNAYTRLLHRLEPDAEALWAEVAPDVRLATRHGDAVADEDVSGYYVAADIATTTKGMLIAIGPAHWDAFETMPAAAFAAELVSLATAVNLSHYRKHPRGPKRPQPHRVHDRASPHVSTHRLLEDRKAKCKQTTRPEKGWAAHLAIHLENRLHCVRGLPHERWARQKAA